MFGKISALFDLFRKGQTVANPSLWKNGGMTANILSGFILAAVHLAAIFGHPIPIDSVMVDKVVAAILTIVNSVVIPITSHDVGLPAKVVEPANQGPQSPQSLEQVRQSPMVSGPADRH